jgi:hypothetical protein
MEITRYMFFFLGKSLTNGNLKKEEGVRWIWDVADFDLVSGVDDFLGGVFGLV